MESVTRLAVNDMKYSLKVKLSISYALVALLLVALVSLFSNFLLQDQFEKYIIRQQEGKNEEIVLQIAQQYDPNTKTYHTDSVESIGTSALSRGMIVKVSDASGNVVWDAMVHNNGMCNQMLQNMADNMLSRYPNFEGAYEEKSYPVISGTVSAGNVSVGYYGPFYFSDNDAAFIDALNRALLTIGIVSLVFALLLGFFMARRISHPITQATGAAEKIAKGDYSDKIKLQSNTLELDKLVTSINSLSSELENQDLLRKRLTADIAHELRTPLSTLQGNIEALIDGIWQPDKNRFLSCHEEILRLTRLVSDLEKLARLENENSSVDKTAFDLKLLAEKTALSFEPLCLEKNIRMTVSGTAQTVEADGDKMRQVLVNLISNSLKYTPEGGRIKVSIAGEGGFASLTVEDNGIGIAQDDLPYIFGRFYRADRSRSSRSGGAGIGLAIAKAIVEMHGGWITVESEPGKGTKFTVSLPVAL